jgi:hypothetical protein
MIAPSKRLAMNSVDEDVQKKRCGCFDAAQFAVPLRNKRRELTGSGA